MLRRIGPGHLKELALTNIPPSFLVTASERTYAIVMNASIAEGDRNFTEYIDLELGVVSNGTGCDQEVGDVKE